MNVEAKHIPTYQSFNDKEMLTQSIKHYITSIVILGLGVRSYNEDGPTRYISTLFRPIDAGST